MKNIFDVASKLVTDAVDFLRKENWVGALVIVVLAGWFLSRSDSQEEKEDIAKIHAYYQEREKAAAAVCEAKNEAIQASSDKFKADILDQYRKDKEANDAIIREITLNQLKQKGYIKRVGEQQQKNIIETKKIESKIDQL